MTPFIVVALLWGGSALILAAFDHFKKHIPVPKHSEIFPMLPCHEEVIMTQHGPGAADALNMMEHLGLVVRFNGYVTITRYGEEVMK